jgi:hypothetical protein
VNDESTPKGAHEIPAPASILSLPLSPLSVPDAAWLDGLSTGLDIGQSLGERAGHMAGYDVGFLDGRQHERAEAEAEHSAELDACNRWIARVIPAAVEARARRVGVSS